MEKIRIVHIAQSEGAGVTEYIKMLATQMPEEKYECIMIGSTYYEKERSYFEGEGWRLITLEMCREIQPLQDFIVIKKLRRLLKNLNPQIIHIHSSKAGLLGRIASIGLRKKVIYNAHGWAFNMKVSSKKILTYKIAEKVLSYKTDKIINISKNEYDTAKGAGIDSKKMIIIKNAINTQKDLSKYNRESILEELEIPSDAYVIGNCGRISEQKSPEIFLDICKEVINQIPNAYFLMIGDGELKEFVLQMAKEYKIESRLKITGWTNEPEKYISILDIALLTSKWEGFGLVLLQYMLQRKPVIAAHVGGIPEIVIDGYTGRTVQWNDIQSYVTNIMDIKEGKIPDIWVKNAYLQVQNEYSLSRLAEEHFKLYSEIINEKLSKFKYKYIKEQEKNTYIEE